MASEVSILKTSGKKQQKASWDETIRTIIFAVILAVTVRSFAYEPFNIPSGSMKSNLLVGDYLFVSKYSYGYSRYSFPFGLPFFSGRIFANEPKRGDIVVFRYPPNPRTDYIKRVIGLPNDRIQVKDGFVYINGKKLERQLVDDFSDKEDNQVKVIQRYAEMLPENKLIMILKENMPNPDIASMDEVKKYIFANNTPEFIVPEGHYFMMGDNRDNSSDSRFDVGFVPAENLIGRAEIIWFSTDGSAKLFNPVSWFSAMRFDRFFNLLN